MPLIPITSNSSYGKGPRIVGGEFSSVILVLLEKDRVIIAADGLVNRIEGSPPRAECKLILMRSKVVFGATGMGRFEQPPFDPYKLAKEVGTKHPILTAAREYGKEATKPINLIWDGIRLPYFRFSGREDPLVRPICPHSYIFAGVDKDGTISASGGAFSEKPGRKGFLVLEEFNHSATTDADAFLWRSGCYDAIPDDMVASQMIKTLEGPEALKRMIDIQIKATPRLVGEPISVIVISKAHAVNWYSPGACGAK